MPKDRKGRASAVRDNPPALLKSLIFDPAGRAMCPTDTRKGGKLYRYYVSQTALKHGADACPIRRVPAGQIEAAVIDQLRTLIVSPEIIVATWKAVRKERPDLTDAKVGNALRRFDPLWDELFPAEQARIVQLLVERVDIAPDGIDISLRVDGLGELVCDLGTGNAIASAEAA